jgi:hypothetical protein
MKQLATTFRKNGFNFKQLLRRDKVALFEKTKPHLLPQRFYEVIIIQEHDDYFMCDLLIPASECYPSSEQWGIYGLSYSDRAKAIAKYQELVALNNNEQA